MSKNSEMNLKFEGLSESKKLEVLGVTEEVFTSHRFKGLDKNVVINDLWNGKTNSEKRSMLKGL